MPFNVDQNLPQIGSFPKPTYLTLQNFKRGVITLIDKSRTPQNALVEAANMYLVEDGQPAVRPGVAWYGSSLGSDAIDGFDYFDFNGVIHLVAVAGGTVYRSTNDGASWTACTGATLTAGFEVLMNQNNTFLYLTNGEDNIVRYDGTTTLQNYTALTTPAAPTAAATPAGAGYSYKYKISAVNKVGFSIASSSVTVTHATPRSAWDKTTDYVTLTLPAYQATQERVDIYLSEDGGLNYYYIDSQSTPNLTYKDDGTAVAIPSTIAPVTNTTQGPKVAELTNIGVRQFGVRDKDNRYRISFTGTGNFSGAFSNAFDGGYLDWQPGGKLIPMKVVDYRDGKGTPIATIWCDSADGQGGILQMSLSTLTIGNITITVPSAYALPGSRGTPSPGSVVNVLNDYMFYNSQAFYNLGSRAQFLNLLSTDESSANIRPTVKQISSAGEAGIASVYFDAKVLFSVPFEGSSTNTQTIVYDTERKAWLPEAFTLGFSKFLRYTDSTNTKRLLALKPGDTRLSEIGENIQGDYGQPFRTSLTTGLYPTARDRFEFQFVEVGEFELSQATGRVTVKLLGYERKAGYTVIKAKSESFTSVVSENGWDTFDWDTTVWDETTVVPKAVSDSSTKRYFNVQKELNSVQWNITTYGLDAGYVLRTLQTWGTETQAGLPTRWRMR